MTRALTAARLTELHKAFAADRHNQLMQNAVAKNPVNDVALNRSVVVSIDASMSHQLDTWKPTNQEKSGRCWLFSGLNLIRQDMARTLGLKDFELSQSWLFYWDKLERANYFLQAMTELADKDIDDRTVAHLLANPIDDGGQWNMFVALIAKYGLVPKYAYPETHSSSNSAGMNARLRRILREGARAIRAAKSPRARTMAHNQTLATVHRVLGIHLGTPPTEFLFQYKDKDNIFHREGLMTPREFADRFVTVPIDDYVCLVNDPRNAVGYGKTYTVAYLGNVVGAPPVTYLNLAIEDLKQLAMESIVGGAPVWFGCDTDKMCNGDLGIWDAALYDYESVYGTTFTMDKAQRLLHGEAMMTHAMLFTGVDVIDGRPRRWRVENSWGEKAGDKGFFTMNDSWFDEHLFEIAVPASMLTAKQRAAFRKAPILLPAWDPMGALA